MKAVERDTHLTQYRDLELVYVDGRLMVEGSPRESQR